MTRRATEGVARRPDRMDGEVDTGHEIWFAENRLAYQRLVYVVAHARDSDTAR